MISTVHEHDKSVNAFLRLISNVVNGSSTLDFNLTAEEWNAVFALARTHNILPLIFEAASEDVIETVSENSSFISSPDYQRLMIETMTTVASQTRRTEAFLSLYKQLLKADLHPIVMKGIICRQLYGEYCDHRPSGDEDILIQKKDFEAVRQILIENGYKAESDNITDAQLEELQEVTFYGIVSGL